MYVIGDVHGCFNTLLNLMSKAPNEEFVFIGDLVDKGLYSFEVLEFVRKNKCRVIKGNHEKLFQLNYDKKYSLWLNDISYGGIYTLESFKRGTNRDLLDSIAFIETLPTYEIIDGYFLTHGFGLPYYNRRDTNTRGIMSNRIERTEHKSDWEDYSDYKVTNIFGHSAFNVPNIGKNYIGIDTGAVYGNKLSMVELGSNEIISVDVDLSDLPANYKDEDYRLIII